MAGSSTASRRHAGSGAAEPPREQRDGVLYVVATPIGNLEDLTLRALRTLGEVDVIAAEDTRRTCILLRQHGISTPVTSYHDAVERERAPRLVARMQAGDAVALVSDAGTPGIADPGYHLVRAAVAAGIRVVPIPGPSAVAALVSVAGIPVERFAFEGFLPSRASARRTRLAVLTHESRAIVLYEAARRLGDCLDDALAVLGDRDVVVGRELTKVHEEIHRGRLAEVARWWRQEGTALGEVVLIIAGTGEDAAVAVERVDVDAELAAGLAAGRGLKDVAAEVAHRAGLSRREVYRRGLALRVLREP